MKNELYEKWDDILEYMKKEFEISDPIYRTFVKPLSIYNIEDNKLTVLIDDVKIGNSKSFVEQRYTTFLSVSIETFTNIKYDITFISLSELSQMKEDTPVNKVKKHNNPTINSKYTFDTFVVGDNNDYAHAAALKVAEEPGDTYNPLYIYGGAGLGKTHLMHAIANYIQDHDENKKVMYVTSETFTNEVIEAVRDSSHSEHAITKQEFRNKYRNVDVLLIDDIQFIIGKESTQMEFFHTFNHLYESQKQIIISSDKHPSTMTTLEERLRSRFEMGLTVDIKAPTYETRMAILRKKVAEENINIDDSILDYIASNIISNIRELQGAINKVLSFSNFCNTEITLESAKKALVDIINPNIKRQITIDYIMETVADHFNITIKDLLSTKRSNNIVYPRHVCMYLCRQLTDSTYEEIGNKIGNRHHSTILHGEDAIKSKLEENDEKTITTIDVLTKKIDPQ